MRDARPRAAHVDDLDGLAAGPRNAARLTRDPEPASNPRTAAPSHTRTAHLTTLDPPSRPTHAYPHSALQTAESSTFHCYTLHLDSSPSSPCGECSARTRPLIRSHCLHSPCVALIIDRASRALFFTADAFQSNHLPSVSSTSLNTQTRSTPRRPSLRRPLCFCHSPDMSGAIPGGAAPSDKKPGEYRLPTSAVPKVGQISECLIRSSSHALCSTRTLPLDESPVAGLARAHILSTMTLWSRPTSNPPLRASRANPLPISTSPRTSPLSPSTSTPPCPSPTSPYPRRISRRHPRSSCP
jgi:hypothetical protein